jgi:myo-inositol-1(or 4)-monophosphatase
VDPDHEFALDLGRRLREAAAPLLGTSQARRRTGTAHGGDPTYGIDEAAERVVEEAFRDREDVAYFTEDEGLEVRGRPRSLFLIDPVDGTRPAVAGFETCVAAVAVAPWGRDVTLGDVTYGCMVELATGTVFEARRGGGARSDGRTLAPSMVRAPDHLFWGSGFRGQPAVAMATVLRDLFDAPGSEGAFFDQGSAGYSLSRVATGQLDAFVDPGPAIVEAVPETEPLFRRLGGGHLLNTVTYDTAAGDLLLWELGCPCTDARGRSLRDVPLIDAGGHASDVSTIAAGTPELHQAVVDLVGAGLRRLREVLATAGPGILHY